VLHHILQNKQASKQQLKEWQGQCVCWSESMLHPARHCHHNHPPQSSQTPGRSLREVDIRQV